MNTRALGLRVETLTVDEPSATSSFEFDFESETLTEKNVRDLVFTELSEFHADLRAAEVSAGGRQSSFPHLSRFPKKMYSPQNKASTTRLFHSLPSPLSGRLHHAYV